MSKKINNFGFDIPQGEFLYNCPRCCEPIHEHDILFIIDGKCYCLNCRRPSMCGTKAFNLIGAERTPTERELAEKLQRMDLI